MALRLVLGFIFSLIYSLVGGLLISHFIMKITGNLSSKEGGDSYSTLMVGAFLAMASVVVTTIINIRLKDDYDRIAAIYAEGIMAAIALATVFANW